MQSKVVFELYMELKPTAWQTLCPFEQYGFTINALAFYQLYHVHVIAYTHSTSCAFKVIFLSDECYNYQWLNLY